MKSILICSMLLMAFLDLTAQDVFNRMAVHFSAQDESSNAEEIFNRIPLIYISLPAMPGSEDLVSPAEILLTPIYDQQKSIFRYQVHPGTEDSLINTFLIKLVIKEVHESEKELGQCSMERKNGQWLQSGSFRLPQNSKGMEVSILCGKTETCAELGFQSVYLFP